MLRLAVIALGTGALVIGGSDSAAAGGAAFNFDREWYMPGDIATGAENVSDVEGTGWIEDGPFFGYLVESSVWAEPRAEDTAWTETLTAWIANGVPLGPLETQELVPGRAQVSVRFEIPDVPAGRYQVIHCNDPCTAQLGDLIGGWFWIGGPPPPTTLPAAVPAPVVTSPPPSVPEPEPAANTARRAEPSPSDDASSVWIALGAVAAIGGSVALVAIAARRARRPLSSRDLLHRPAVAVGIGEEDE